MADADLTRAPESACGCRIAGPLVGAVLGDAPVRHVEAPGYYAVTYCATHADRAECVVMLARLVGWSINPEPDGVAAGAMWLAARDLLKRLGVEIVIAPGRS